MSGSACAEAGINDLTGRTNQDVPEITVSLSLQHEFMIGDYTLLSRADVNYIDEYYATADLDPLTIQEAYTLFDASVMLVSPDDDWNVKLVAKNITNAEYFYYANDVPLFVGSQFAYFHAPRTLNLEFSYTFE